MIHSETQYTIVSTNVAHGNPVTGKLAHLSAVEISTQVRKTDLSIIPQVASLAMGLLTKSKDLTLDKIKKREEARSGFIAKTFAVLSAAELLLRNPDMLYVSPKAGVGIFVQEHVLIGLPKELLERNFPNGIFLMIPDVFPKKSAIEVMKKKGIKPIVWNKECYELLMKEGLEPVLVAPFFPGSFVDGLEPPLRSRKNMAVVKTSGVGINKGWEEQIIKNKGAGNILTIHHPAHKKIKDTIEDKEKKSEVTILQPNNLVEIYSDFFINSPRLLISYPSEIMQVAASLYARGWEGNFVCLPFRVEHERKNLAWGIRHGIIKGVLDFGDGSVDLVRGMKGVEIIKVENLKYAFNQNLNQPDINNLGLGSKSLRELFLEI